ncbi:MAG: hypothetical protein IJ282_01760 [Lachnospiraceae bacterium]|nr:hypothetical protein [Lachnospiraceae bacterium]
MSVKFHLPGLRYNYPLNMLLLSLLEKYPENFREGVEIASFFGEFPLSLWNGGRYSRGDQCDPNFVKGVIKNINSHGIPVRYTYTNPTITEKDLDDPYCNFCMQAADNGMNEVLVVSPILEKYIREKYPSFKVNSSTCKEIRDVEGLNKELEKDYALVVLDYNLNNKFELLEQIEDKGRCEILINACCTPNCQRRGAHYKAMAEMQRIELANRKLPPNKQIPVPPSWECPCEGMNNIYNIQNFPTFVSPQAIWEKYVPMGFQHFKIEGRTSNIFQILDTYCFYLFKPEKKDEMRFLLLTNLENNKIIQVNKPKKYL